MTTSIPTSLFRRRIPMRFVPPWSASCPIRRSPPSAAHARAGAPRKFTRRVGSQKGLRRSCAPPRRVTSTRDDRLRGPDPLPRAVRKPVPARRAGEVPRLAARYCVDARKPRAPDGRVPARLLRALEDAVRFRRSLRTLSARRSLRLDLLLHIRAGCLALDAGQREPDSENTLPAPARAVVDRRDPPALLRGDARRPARAELRAAPARARDGVAAEPDRGGRRRDRERSRAGDRFARRTFPRHRVPRRRVAAAAVLPDAGAVSAHVASAVESSQARRAHPLGESARACDSGAARAALLRRSAARGGRRLPGRRV